MLLLLFLKCCFWLNRETLSGCTSPGVPRSAWAVVMSECECEWIYFGFSFLLCGYPLKRGGCHLLVAVKSLVLSGDIWQYPLTSRPPCISDWSITDRYIKKRKIWKRLDITTMEKAVSVCACEQPFGTIEGYGYVRYVPDPFIILMYILSLWLPSSFQG